MHALLYDGTFDGFLSAVFDVYYYKFEAPSIVKESSFNGNVFEKVHTVHTDATHSTRVWTGLAKRLSPDALEQAYKTFLSGVPNMENVLLHYVQYAFRAETAIETDFGNAAVLAVHQMAKKVQREKHRMEAFVRFQQTADGLYYAIIEPDFDVLPLITKHFRDRYADQRWMIWDGKRKYGIYYDLQTVTLVQVSFGAGTNSGKDVSAVYDESEALYQQLWQHYFKSVNIPARKNTRLHLQHMPVRYWKYLPEKRSVLK
jgi:probable DNA metabolism protein